LAILLVRIASVAFLLGSLETETAQQTTPRPMRPKFKKSLFSFHLIGKGKGMFTL
jgi:hypothetical protein